MKFPLLAFLLFFGINAYAQLSDDKISTNKGPLIIQPIQHASFVMNWNGKTIYVDPTGGPAAFKNSNKPDLIFLTDIHGDHYDLKTLQAVITPQTTLIAPLAVANLLPQSLKTNLVILNNGQKSKISKITATAVPMYNLPEDASSRHIKGRGNGYVLKTGNKKIYISGDTEDISEMRSLKDIDVAFVCMNLPYTMDIKQASEAVLDFKPKVVYPYHYRGQGGLSDINKFKEIVNLTNSKIEVRLLKWY
ncbi:MAG: MBL fold metallo-hydrolase [Sphingobacteriaceae bacterium]|nr:MBL fold metallo-hydrolase [Sphingobacteriaceae bacterium]